MLRLKWSLANDTGTTGMATPRQRPNLSGAALALRGWNLQAGIGLINAQKCDRFFPFFRLRFMKYSEFAGMRVCPLDFSFGMRYAKDTNEKGIHD